MPNWTRGRPRERLEDEHRIVWLAVEVKRALRIVQGQSGQAISDARLCALVFADGFVFVEAGHAEGTRIARRIKSISTARRIYVAAKAQVDTLKQSRLWPTIGWDQQLRDELVARGLTEDQLAKLGLPAPKPIFNALGWQARR